MKKSDIKDLKSKPIYDLVKKVQDQRKELADILLEKSVGKPKNVHETQLKRKEIAQILTILNQKKFEANININGKKETGKGGING